jgi:hypothetical protein
MGRTDIGAVLQAMSIEMPTRDLLNENSGFHKLIDVAGLHAEKELTLDAPGASQENLFQYTGTLLVHLIMAFCTESTDSTTLSNFKFQVDDGGAQDDITATVNASGAAVGTVLFKSATAANALEIIDPTNAVVTDAGAKNLFEPFFVTQKTATASYIRVSYTGDGAADTDWTFVVHYTPVQEDATLVAVP